MSEKQEEGRQRLGLGFIEDDQQGRMPRCQMKAYTHLARKWWDSAHYMLVLLVFAGVTVSRY